MAKTISVGRTVLGERIMLTPKQRSTHVQIVGGSGKGKSRLMQAMIQQDIHHGHGLCLIDPHGSLCNAVLRWMTEYPDYLERKIVLFDPGLRDFVVGYNPLEQRGRSPNAVADTVVEAIAQATNTKKEETPRLQRILTAVLYALIEKGLTLNEAMYLVESEDPDGLREYITSDLEFDHFRNQWRSYNKMSQGQNNRRFREEFESTYNRLNQFLDDPQMRLIFGQKERTMNLQRFMDEGYVVLVNLGLEQDVMSRDDAITIGSLLLNDFYTTALQRHEGARPFYLYIDECYDFLTGDVERMLDQTRKFGLHLTLAHQRLGQLRQRGEDIYDAVMEGAQTKLVFGVQKMANASELAVELFGNTFDLETPKTSMDKPVVVAQIPIWLQSESYSESEASSYSESSSSTVGGSSYEVGEETVEVDSSTDTDSSGYSSSSSKSETKGRQQTLKSVFEERPTQLFSLEELTHLAAVRLRRLQTREIVAYRVGDKEPLMGKTPEIADYYLPTDELLATKQNLLERSEVVTPLPKAQAILEERKQRLVQRQSLQHTHEEEPSFLQAVENDD